MNSDAPLYLTIASAAALGLFFAIRKVKSPESKVVFPFACAAFVLTVASVVLHASQTDFILIQAGDRTIDGLLPMLFGFGLLFGIVSMVAGAAYFIIRFSCITISARKNMK